MGSCRERERDDREIIPIDDEIIPRDDEMTRPREKKKKKKMFVFLATQQAAKQKASKKEFRFSVFLHSISTRRTVESGEKLEN